jgi:phosphate transport system substrate-binding protein
MLKKKISTNFYIAGITLSIISSILILSACNVNNESESSNKTAVECEKGKLLMAGSTAQRLSMSEWIKRYHTKCSSASVIDGGGGSGLGLTQFADRATDVAGTDFPVTDPAQASNINRRCAPGHLLNLPMVVSSISIHFNIDKISNITLDAKALAMIFQGQIANWNDPYIQSMNQNLKLPNLTIKPVYRADASGTTYNFTNYLNQNAPEVWKTVANKSFPNTANNKLQGATGSAGIVQNVSTNNGAIGYVETSYVATKQFKTAFVKSNDGKATSGKTLKSVENFIKDNGVIKSNDNGVIVDIDFSKKSDETRYPLAMITYEVVCNQNPNKLVKSFLKYTVSDDAQDNQPFGYVPLPETLRSKVQAQVDAMD